MLYKLIIADDEDIIRTGIVSIIDWESLGFKVIADFDDGSGVIEYIKTNHVDAILTDIRMSKLSGLDIARYLHENKLAIRIILISGFKDFEYAQQAIQFDVAHYFTKPINFVELINYFKSLKVMLDQEKEKHNKEQEQNKKISEMLPLLKEQFFSDLISGALTNPQDINNRAKVVGIDFDLSEVLCSFVHLQLLNLDKYLIEKWKYGHEGFKNALRNFLQGKGSIKYYPIFANLQDILVIAVVQNKNDNSYTQNLSEILSNNLKELKDLITNILDLDLNFEIESKSCSIYDLHKHKQILNWKVNQLENSTEVLSPESESKLLQKQNWILQKAENYIKENYSKDISLDDIANQVYLSSAYFSQLFKEVKGINFSDYLIKIRVDKAMELLTNPQYKIQEISHIVGYRSSKYFARAFKKITGCTPTEYQFQAMKEGNAIEQ